MPVVLNCVVVGAPDSCMSLSRPLAMTSRVWTCLVSFFICQQIVDSFAFEVVSCCCLHWLLSACLVHGVILISSLPLDGTQVSLTTGVNTYTSKSNQVKCCWCLTTTESVDVSPVLVDYNQTICGICCHVVFVYFCCTEMALRAKRLEALLNHTANQSTIATLTAKWALAVAAATGWACSNGELRDRAGGRGGVIWVKAGHVAGVSDKS